MKSLDATYRKFSSRGVDGASGLLGIGLGRAELAEYSFWVINRDDETAWSYGPNKGY
jgi:hypothetical protein